MLEAYDGPPMLPLVGNGLDFLGRPRDVLYKGIKFMKTYSNPFKLWIVHKPYMVIFDPVDFEIASCKTLEKDDSYRFIVDMLGDGIFTSQVEKWRRNRRIINPTFNPRILCNYFLNIFATQNRRLLSRLENEVGTGKEFNLWPYIIQTSISTICETAMGYHDAKEENTITQFGQAVIKSAELVSQRFYKPWLMPSFIFSIYKKILGFGHVFNIVHSLPLKMLKVRRKEYETIRNSDDPVHEDAKRNFINTLINYHETNPHFTDKELSDEVISIMFGGSETNAITNCFTMLMFGMRQDLQEKVYEEIYDVFGDSDRPPTIEDLNKLCYLEQCIKETLRRFPPVPIVIRYAPQDIALSNGNVIPAGCNIILGIYGIHHDPKIYENPETWDPSHFDPDKVANRHKCSFIPFSFGPRGCIGQKYAWVSMKAQLSTLLRNFKVSTDVKLNDIELDVDLVIRNLNGYKIKLDYRHGKSLF